MIGHFFLALDAPEECPHLMKTRFKIGKWYLESKELWYWLASGKGNYCSTQNLPHFPQNFAQNTYFSHCIPPPHHSHPNFVDPMCSSVMQHKY
jgi:hypothetical protein